MPSHFQQHSQIMFFPYQITLPLTYSDIYQQQTSGTILYQTPYIVTSFLIPEIFIIFLLLPSYIYMYNLYVLIYQHHESAFIINAPLQATGDQSCSAAEQKVSPGHLGIVTLATFAKPTMLAWPIAQRAMHARGNKPSCKKPDIQA